MAGQLLKRSLLLMSLACYLSTKPVTADMETNNAEHLSILGTNVPPVAALNDNITSDKVTTLIETSKQGLISHEVNTTQEANPAGGATPEEKSTFTPDVMTNWSIPGKDAPPAAITPRSDTNLTTNSTALPLTSHKDDNDHSVTLSTNPSAEMPSLGPTKVPKDTTTTTKPISDKDKKKIISIVVCMVILILILVSILIIMVRSKRRRGSQSFSTRSRSSNRQDVWAGQVPELGDGKMTPHPTGMENGKAGNKAEPGTEQEMSTFISGEKKDDSMVEMNELGKGEALDEKKPLLEETSQGPEEVEKNPEEKIPAPTVEQELV